MTTRFEYSTRLVTINAIEFKTALPGLVAELNEATAQGWRLKELVLPSLACLPRNCALAVALLERPVDAKCDQA